MKKKAGPVFYGGIGLAFLVVFIMGTLAQISTTETALLGNQASVEFFHPNWEVLLQPLRMIGLVGPALSGKEGSADFAAWCISIIYLGAVVGNEIFDDARDKTSIIFKWVFRIALGVMIIFDFWTDLQYGTMVFGSTFGSFIFGCVVGFVVAFAGIIGTDFLEKAFKAL